MWSQHYVPVAGSLAASAAVAALPVFVLIYMLGVRRMAAWAASLGALASAVLVALFVYRMPAGMALGAIGYGAAFGIFPIGWIVFTAILLYRITVQTGRFEALKDSIGSLTSDRRLQALLIAFAFGAFLEGAAGFGSPVAVAAAMLAGLGFSPFYAAAICLLANTAPVAFGSIGIPVVTLAGVTGLPLDRISAGVGRICAPLSLIIPAYLVAVMGGWKALRGVLAGVAVCGVSFASVQFLVSNFVGPQLTDILASLAAILSLVILFLVWKPKDAFQCDASGGAAAPARRRAPREVGMAWTPYGLLVICVLLWGWEPIRTALNGFNVNLSWPGLHNLVQRMPPIVPRATPYAARYTFNWLAASGTACLSAVLASALLLRMPRERVRRRGSCHNAAAALSPFDVRCCAGPCVSYELFGRNRDARLGICRNRTALSVL